LTYSRGNFLLPYLVKVSVSS